MLKRYKNDFTSPDKGFYSLSLSGIKSAIGCEKVIPRSDSKLLDLQRVVMKRAFVKALKNRLRMNEV